MLAGPFVHYAAAGCLHKPGGGGANRGMGTEKHCNLCRGRTNETLHDS